MAPRRHRHRSCRLPHAASSACGGLYRHRARRDPRQANTHVGAPPRGRADGFSMPNAMPMGSGTPPTALARENTGPAAGAFEDGVAAAAPATTLPAAASAPYACALGAAAGGYRGTAAAAAGARTASPRAAANTAAGPRADGSAARSLRGAAYDPKSPSPASEATAPATACKAACEACSRYLPPNSHRTRHEMRSAALDATEATNSPAQHVRWMGHRPQLWRVWPSIWISRCRQCPTGRESRAHLQASSSRTRAPALAHTRARRSVSNAVDYALLVQLSCRAGFHRRQ